MRYVEIFECTYNCVRRSIVVERRDVNGVCALEVRSVSSECVQTYLLQSGIVVPQLALAWRELQVETCLSHLGILICKASLDCCGRNPLNDAVSAPYTLL